MYGLMWAVPIVRIGHGRMMEDYVTTARCTGKDSVLRTLYSETERL
jgi:hypothetical protein